MESLRRFSQSSTCLCPGGPVKRGNTLGCVGMGVGKGCRVLSVGKLRTDLFGVDAGVYSEMCLRGTQAVVEWACVHGARCWGGGGEGKEGLRLLRVAGKPRGGLFSL